MTVAFGGKRHVRSMIASLGVAFLLVPGCGPAEEPGQPKPPPNPSPRADLGEPVQPKFPRPGESESSKQISKVEKDLHKDLAPPTVIAPSAPANPPSPTTAKPGTP